MNGETRMVDIVFPGDTNHHGTLFGGVGLALMDKVAFMAASRHGRVDFVTASCDRIDFEAPAHLGEIVDLAGRVVRTGRRSLSVEVEMVAEKLQTGERRRCSRGAFNMVAVGRDLPGEGLPPLRPTDLPTDGELRSAEIVFPEQTSHYGSLYGGNAMSGMGKLAFVAATRRSRRAMVLAAVRRIDFTSQVRTGELVEMVARVASVGRTSLTALVDVWAESLRSGDRRHCGTGEFVFVAIDAGHRPVAIEGD